MLVWIILHAGVPHCTVMHQPFNIIHRPVATHCTASPLAPVCVLYTGHTAVYNTISRKFYQVKSLVNHPN